MFLNIIRTNLIVKIIKWMFLNIIRPIVTMNMKICTVGFIHQIMNM